MHKLSRRAATLLGAIVLFSAAGVAWAAWTSSGTGSGSATSTTSVNSTISPDTAAGGLYPGATTTFTVTINNPNPYPVKVTSVAAGSSNVVNVDCAAGSVFSDAATPNTAIAAGPSTTATVMLTAHMIASPDNACKSQSFTLPLTATLASTP